MGSRIREDKRGGAVYVCHGRDGRGLSWVGSRIREDKRGGAVYVCQGRDGRGLSWVGSRIREDKRGGAVYVCQGRDGRGLTWVGMDPRIREDTGGGQPQGIAPTGRCVANYFHSSGGSDFGALQAIL